jgi:hypothetical protein
MPHLLYTFHFNAPCQYTPPLNFSPLIFGFNTILLAMLYYANPYLFLIIIQVLICLFDLHQIFEECN